MACVSVLASLGAGACVERAAEDPGTFARATPGVVRCSADENGDLHVRAPAWAAVRATEDASAEIETAPSSLAAIDYPQMPRPRRPRSISLGFIGDGKLSPSPSHGDRWTYGARDVLLPPHAHRVGLRQFTTAP